MAYFTIGRRIMRSLVARQFSTLVGGITLTLVFLLPSWAQEPIVGGPANVLTWQQDTNLSDEFSGCSYRTGENLNEATVTYKTIATDGFGLLCSYQLDGRVYAGSLVITEVTAKG